MREIPHADYPHDPGSLYDCEACETQCFCKPGMTQCVYSGEHNGSADEGTETHGWVPLAVGRLLESQTDEIMRGL